MLFNLWIRNWQIATNNRKQYLILIFIILRETGEILDINSDY